MGTILSLPLVKGREALGGEASAAPKSAERKRENREKNAEIVFFTGVRYAREAASDATLPVDSRRKPPKAQ